MNWRMKARIQNVIARLPSELSYEIYYMVQRTCGSLRTVNPVSRLCAGVELCRQIEKTGKTVNGKVFFEVGTGRRVNVPIAFYLAGAKKTITVDVNPYLKSSLVKEDVDYISRNRDEIIQLFGGLLDLERLDVVTGFSRKKWNLQDFLETCHVEYVPHGDAASTEMAHDTVDYHVSNNVFEHVPPEVISAILIEGGRVVKKNGFFLHQVDFTDHFSHSDPTISKVNFLKYSDDEWEKVSGNRYMYVNRLRVDDVTHMYTEAGHEIIGMDSTTDPRAVEELRACCTGLDPRFAAKSEEVLSTMTCCVISRVI